jgi:hypothetical protein
MKMSPFFNTLMIMSMIITYSACDQSSDAHENNLKPNDDVALSTRGDCDLCPGGDECCCMVFLQPTGIPITLEFCGTSNGGAVCVGAATGNCPSFLGGGQTLTLTLDDPRKPFCMDENTPFYIKNTTTTDTAKIIITCQADFTPPDTMWLQIPPGQFRYIQTNGNCAVDPC